MKGLSILLGLLVAATPAAAKKGDTTWSQTWTSDSDHMDFAYALVEKTDDGGTLALNGTEDDRDDLLELRDKTDGTFVWIRNKGDRYLVRDPETVARAREILAPEIEISRASGELGAIQGSLGMAQSKVGVAQGDIGVRQGQIGVRMSQIAIEKIGLEPNSARAKELDREQESLEQEMEDLGRAQEHLGAKQSRMGDDQSRLGEEQGKDEHARKEVYARVRTDMKHLLRDSIGNGTARRI